MQPFPYKSRPNFAMGLLQLMPNCYLLKIYFMEAGFKLLNN